MHTKQTLSLSEAAISAKKVFGLTAPFTSLDLKKAYRRVSMDTHPDKKGGSKKAFQEMSSLYVKLSEMQWLAGLFTHDVGSPSDLSVAVTTDGTPLSVLGLGLGPTTNGRDCECCNHNGYLTYHGKHFVVCDRCDEQGRVPKEFQCRSCQGTGKFTLRRSLKEVDCRSCNGTGKFKHPNLSMFCASCHGTKTLWVDNGKPYYTKCFNCNGTGEIKIMNPVIPKGVLAALNLR